MKDKKININVGNEKLSKEEIDSHKDFKKVYESYLTTKMKPMKVAKKYTFTKMVALTTTVAVVTVTVWKYTSVRHTVVKTLSTASVKHSSVVVKHNEASKKPFINPPVKGIDVPYKSYTMDAAKGGVLVYNKTKITIPAHALCDGKGNEIKGSVTISYREFHDAIDFFVSGIPMTYDSAGKQYNFESAGMLDIKGSQNGKPVFIKPGKNIQVAMSSFQRGTKYNVYKLDTITKNWTYIEKSKYVVQSAKPDKAPQQQGVKDTAPNIPSKAQTELTDVTKQLTKLEAEKPVKANDNNYRLSIDADTTTLPELAIFKNVIFEVDPSDKNYKPEWENTEWTDAKLTKTGNEKSYIFTVSKGSVKHDILVHPVFQGKDFENAMKEYSQKYNAYLAKIEAEKEEIHKQKEAYKKMMVEDSIKAVAEMKEEQRKQKEAYEKLSAEQKKEQAASSAIEINYKTSMTVINYLTLNNFGIINCDCPHNFPSKAKLLATYEDANNNPLAISYVYLIEKDKNSVVPENYPTGAFVFDPGKRNFAWAITTDNKLAMYSEDSFDKIKQTTGDFTFAMTVLDKKINTEEDVRRALEPYMD